MAGEQFLYNRPTFPAQLNMAHPLTRGLVGCWVLNENSPNSMRAWDSSPYGNHGVVTGAQGRWQGMTFDGNDSINCGNNASIKDITTAISIISLSRLDVAGNYPMILTKGSDEREIRYEAGTRNPCLVLKINANPESLFNSAVSLNTWHHIVGTYDSNGGSANMRLYIDSILDVSATKTGLMSTTDTNQFLGKRPNDTLFFTGIIGAVIIYNRALTAAEIQQHYLEPYAMFL